MLLIKLSPEKMESVEGKYLLKFCFKKTPFLAAVAAGRPHNRR